MSATKGRRRPPLQLKAIIRALVMAPRCPISEPRPEQP
jgi:hypothetical protein